MLCEQLSPDNLDRIGIEGFTDYVRKKVVLLQTRIQLAYDTAISAVIGVNSRPLACRADCKMPKERGL